MDASMDAIMADYRLQLSHMIAKEKIKSNMTVIPVPEPEVESDSQAVGESQAEPAAEAESDPPIDAEMDILPLGDEKFPAEATEHQVMDDDLSAAHLELYSRHDNSQPFVSSLKQIMQTSVKQARIDSQANAIVDSADNVSYAPAEHLNNPMFASPLIGENLSPMKRIRRGLAERPSDSLAAGTYLFNVTDGESFAVVVAPNNSTTIAVVQDGDSFHGADAGIVASNAALSDVLSGRSRVHITANDDEGESMPVDGDLFSVGPDIKPALESSPSNISVGAAAWHAAPNPEVSDAVKEDDATFQQNVEAQQNWDRAIATFTARRKALALRGYLPAIRIDFFNLYFLALQIAIAVIYAFLADFSSVWIPSNNLITSSGAIAEYYSYYTDICVFVFFGLGLMFTSLMKGSHTAVIFNYVIGAIVWQWGILIIAYADRLLVDYTDNSRLIISMKTVIQGLYATTAVLISLGAFAGKASPLQTLVVAMFEVFAYGFVYWACIGKLTMVEYGGAVTIHMFGAFFGFCASALITEFHPSETAKVPKNFDGHKTRYASEIFSYFGMLMLWIYFPSFNAAFAPGSSQYRIAINTVLSLCSAAATSIFMSTLLRPDSKLHMYDMARATLAGAIAMGSCGGIILGPGMSMGVGFITSTVVILSIVHIQPWMEAHGCYDTMGVLYSHGVGGIIGGGIGAAAVGIASKDATIFNTTYSALFINPGDQAGYQLAGMAVVLGTGVIGGLLTGGIARILPFRPSNYYKDEIYVQDVPRIEYDDRIDVDWDELALKAMTDNTLPGNFLDMMDKSIQKGVERPVVVQKEPERQPEAVQEVNDEGVGAVRDEEAERLAAEELARQRAEEEEESRRRAEEETKRRAEEEEKKRRAKEEEQRRQAEEAERKRQAAEEAARKKAEDDRLAQIALGESLMSQKSESNKFSFLRGVETRVFAADEFRRREDDTASGPLGAADTVIKSGSFRHTHDLPVVHGRSDDDHHASPTLAATEPDHDVAAVEDAHVVAAVDESPAVEANTTVVESPESAHDDVPALAAEEPAPTAEESAPAAEEPAPTAEESAPAAAVAATTTSDGFSVVAPVTSDVRSLTLLVREDCELTGERKFAAFEPTMFTRKDSTYRVKVSVGDGEYIHIAYASDGETPSLEEYVEGCDETTPLEFENV